MKAFEVTERKMFMSALLGGTVFDDFTVSELQLLAAYNLKLDGHRTAAFYTPEELEQLPEPDYMLWQELKPLVFQMMKGSKTPVSFRIVLRFGKTALAKLTDYTLPENADYFLNIQYEKDSIKLTSGAAMKTFSMDRTAEQSWDIYIEQFLKRSGITLEKL